LRKGDCEGMEVICRGRRGGKTVDKEKPWRNHRRIKIVNNDQTAIELTAEAMLAYHNSKSELHQTLQQYKNNKTIMPDESLRKRISEALGVPVDELFLKTQID
jgi:transcriptional regulator with XRE-family HTH domain